MTIKLQLLPDEDLAAVREKLVPRWLTFGLTTVLDEPRTARGGSPLDHPVFRAIEATLHDQYPGAPLGPYFLPWTATDARFFRAAGVPAYGFSPFLVMNTDTLSVDGVNEPADTEGTTIGPFYRRLAAAIRAVDPEHILFLDGNRYSTQFDQLGDPLPNAVYTAHDYALPGFVDGVALYVKLVRRLVSDT